MRFVFWQGKSGIRRIYVRGHGLPAAIFVDEGGLHVGRRWGLVSVSDLAGVEAMVRDFSARFGGVRKMLVVLVWRREEQRSNMAFEMWISTLPRLVRLVVARMCLHVFFFIQPLASKSCG